MDHCGWIMTCAWNYTGFLLFQGRLPLNVGASVVITMRFSRNKDKHSLAHVFVLAISERLRRGGLCGGVYCRFIANIVLWVTWSCGVVRLGWQGLTWAVRL